MSTNRSNGTKGSSLSAASPRNPSYLPDRYEIRRLAPEHSDWAKAIFVHSNLFHSTVWGIIYPKNLTARLHSGFRTMTHLIDHQIESGMSFGVFDTEYQFKRPESEATGGKLYWDESEDADGAELLRQMDFPLVSIALSLDLSKPFDMDKITPMFETVPAYRSLLAAFDERDKRDPDTWFPKGPREVLQRNATSTRHDYEGAGVMKKTAQFVMREAKLEGYRGIQIECLHDAVTHVWLRPPAPFSAELVCDIDFSTYSEKDDNGETVKPLSPSKQVASKVYVHL